MSRNEEFRTSKKLPMRRQWYVRVFINNLILLGLLIFMMSPFLTFLYVAGVLGVPPSEAMLWTAFHAISAIGLFVGDFCLTIYRTSAKRYIYGPMMNSETEGNFVALELTYYKHLNKVVLDNPVLGIDRETNREVEVAQEVFAYYVELVGVPERKQIWLLPDTLEKTFVWHRETAPTKYPVPAWVSYAGFTLMLPFEYEGDTIPIYEVTYSPLIIARRQMQLPWWQPDSASVEGALVHFDSALAAEWRGKYENLLAFTKSELKRRVDAEEYGEEIADHEINLKRRIGSRTGSRNSGFTTLKRYKWWILAVASVCLIIVPIVWWSIIQTPASPSTNTNENLTGVVLSWMRS